MNRLVLSVLIVSLVTVVARGTEQAPFQVLVSNDTTNIVSNVGPHHEREEPFRPEMIEASVDETAGRTDVHTLRTCFEIRTTALRNRLSSSRQPVSTGSEARRTVRLSRQNAFQNTF